MKNGEMQPVAMHPVFETLCSAYRQRLAGQDSAFCQLCPGEACWTTQNVIEHLVLTYRNTGKLLEKYLLRGSPTGSSRRVRHHLAQLWVLRLGRFPHGVSAPDFVHPGRIQLPRMAGEELCALMHAELADLDLKITACETAFGPTRFASHFAIGPMTATQWRRFHCVHGRHHLAQLARIREAVGRQPVIPSHPPAIEISERG